MQTKLIENLNLWIKNSAEDKDILDELEKIKPFEEKVKERFYKDLNFGTAGIRGKIGAGTNRINIFVVGRITQALCNHLKKEKEPLKVAIGYDSRHKSFLFAQYSARIFAANGVKAYIFKDIAAVPLLSFAVRNLKCSFGVMVTASHNPACYNGYKVYGKDGAQLNEKNAEKIYNILKKLDIFKDVKKMDFKVALKEEKISYIKKDLIEDFYFNLEQNLINKDCLKEEDFKLVYTPLNGAGCVPVKDMFFKLGVKNFFIVKEQQNPDPDFKTCTYPNPEFKEALELGLKYSKEKKADLLIATDPDCDRLGAAVFFNKNKEEYLVLNGNEIGILMFYYICQQRTKKNIMPKNPVMVKTIVSSGLVEKIAKDYGVFVVNVLIGFKNIGEQIKILEEKNQEQRFIFGFEESHGYLTKGYVRDKDGVFAAVFFSEIVAFYKKQNMLITEVLEKIYEKYGYYVTSVESYAFEGEQGAKKIENIMKNLRELNLKEIGDFKVLKILDYLKGVEINLENNSKKELNFSKANILEYKLKNSMSLIVRPSGTEPKIKLYITAVGKTKKESKDFEQKLKKSFNLNFYVN